MRLRSALLDFALPPACAGCGHEETLLCPECSAPLYRRLEEPPGVALGLPAMLPLPLVQLEWCASFTGPVRVALHELKYSGERRLAGPLSEALAARWASVRLQADLIVGVPVHPARLKQRGYDQADLLAAALARQVGRPHLQALERTRETVPQFDLGRGARRVNVAGAFGVKRSADNLVAGRWIVLVDDVATTGATLAACAEALYAARAKAVSALTVARER